MAQTVTLPAFHPKQVVVLAVNRAEAALRKVRDEASRAALIAELLGRDDARPTHVDLIAIDVFGETDTEITLGPDLTLIAALNQ